MDLSEKRQHVTKALRLLETAINHLVSALAHRPARISVQDAANDRIALERACAVYAAINYGMEDEPSHSVVCLGVIGVSAETLNRAEAVNAAKLALKKVCSPMHGIQVRVPEKGKEGPTKKISALRAILRSIQRSDLNLLAAYRTIPVLTAPPLSVSFTRANTRAVYRKSVDELFQLLMNAEGPGASADRARLHTLTPHETHLALVKERYRNIRANIVYSRLDKRGRGRIQMAAEMPLMYTMAKLATYPEIRFPKDTSDGPSRPAHQRQSQILERPFLQTLPVYRYSR